MPLVNTYHRPTDLDEALMLLARPHTRVLAGGTVVNADRAPGDLAVVDLQALGLGGVTAEGTKLRVGATTTLDELARSEVVPSALATVARAEAPSTLRTLATVGGVIAGADRDSVLLAALLVYGTQVEIAGGDDVSLDRLLDDGLPPGAIITAISCDIDGAVSSASTGRTPADVPIVAAVARASADGPVLALTGVAERVLLVDAQHPVASIRPQDDFRGSAAYRTRLADVLSTRAIEGLN